MMSRPGGYDGRKEGFSMSYLAADYGLQLPSMWVYVWFDGGARQSVAHTDDLTSHEAQEFHDRWEKVTGKKILLVTLENSNGNVIKKYRF